MKRLILALLFTTASTAAAQAAAPGTQQTAVQASSAATVMENKYFPEITDAVKNLSLLLRRGAEIKPEKLDALAAEMKKFNDKVKNALGTDILAQAAAEELTAENRARTAAAAAALHALRIKLQAHYAREGGVYPADLAALPGGPHTLHLPGHAQSDAVRIIDSKQYDKDIAAASGDSGGWLYFSNPGSANYGMLLLDCGHKDSEGTEFSKY
ncbi:MAG: hypothetical protein A2234_06845 [Elusimicrobia bacterium RIFOXYA2_FULL_58_8]|nr:MAG: hypothetical protein A2234_06845 [Elusimicrobia bacterium RIFOXYA2_FULL_58_8]